MSMLKRRKKAMSAEEARVHEQAVRIRRLSDEALVAAVQGFQPVAAPKVPVSSRDRVLVLLDGLSAGECKGVAGATAFKVRQYAREKGLLL